MDFSSTIYDSTASDNFFSSTHSNTGLSVEQTNSVLNQLLSTIELSTLGSVFFSQLSNYLPVAAIDLSDFGAHLRYGRLPNKRATEIIALALPSVKAGLYNEDAAIKYVFSASPTVAQRRVLATLHQLFTQPLIHALEFKRLKLLATKDVLTGVNNRNAFNDRCSRLLNLAERKNGTFGLLVIDLDNFKQVNDAFGHQEGDNVLIDVANLLQATLRCNEEIYRFGGDEFCCLLEDIDKQSLTVVAERLRSNVEASEYLAQHEVSCSIGGAIYQQGDDMAALFKRADSALYHAKSQGKNAFQAA